MTAAGRTAFVTQLRARWAVHAPTGDYRTTTVVGRITAAWRASRPGLGS
jgi:hypothetical protein